MNPMKIAIAGSSGFIAGELIREFNNYEIIKLVRNDFSLIKEELAEKIKDADVIINLAGYPIIKRWTKSNKRKFMTVELKQPQNWWMLFHCLRKNIHFINASAIGIYGEQDIHTEESRSYSEGFIYEVLTDWEHEAMKAANIVNNVTILRIGIVLAKDSGLIKK